MPSPTSRISAQSSAAISAQRLLSTRLRTKRQSAIWHQSPSPGELKASNAFLLDLWGTHAYYGMCSGSSVKGGSMQAIRRNG